MYIAARRVRLTSNLRAVKKQQEKNWESIFSEKPVLILETLLLARCKDS